MSSNKEVNRLAVRHALYVAALASALAAGQPAFGQDGGDKVIEEIIITGSRLVRQDYQAASPIATVDRAPWCCWTDAGSFRQTRRAWWISTSYRPR